MKKKNQNGEVQPAMAYFRSAKQSGCSCSSTILRRSAGSSGDRPSSSPRSRASVAGQRQRAFAGWLPITKWPQETSFKTFLKKLLEKLLVLRSSCLKKGFEDMFEKKKKAWISADVQGLNGKRLFLFLGSAIREKNTRGPGTPGRPTTWQGIIFTSTYKSHRHTSTNVVSFYILSSGNGFLREYQKSFSNFLQTPCFVSQGFWVPWSAQKR